MACKQSEGSVPVPSSAYRVQVASVIHPAAFWVVDPAGPESGRAKVLDLEKKLGNVVNSSQRIYTNVGQWVAIRNPNTSAWHRGLVNNIIQIGDKYIYVVFLVDHGTCLHVDTDSLVELPKSFQRLPVQAFEVVQDGIEPQLQDRRAITSRWSDDAITYISQVLDTVLYVYCVPTCIMENKIYGDLYLHYGHECKSLSVILCDKGYAKKCISVCTDGVENVTRSLAGKGKTLENDNEIDGGFISNCVTRMQQKNTKNRKPNTESTKPLTKEPEFVKTAAAGSAKQSPSPGSSGTLLRSVMQLMEKGNFTLRPSPVTAPQQQQQQQQLSLRPASDTRAELDKNAAAMYAVSADPHRSKDIRKNSSGDSAIVDRGVPSNGSVSQCAVNLVVKHIEDDTDCTVQPSTNSVQVKLTVKKMSTGDSNDNISSGSSQQATVHQLTDCLRSRFDPHQLQETLDTRRVLVHGHEPLQPVDSLQDAHFPVQIHRALEKLNYKSAFNIQLFAWAAIFEGRNTFMLGPACSGKTMSYVLPLLSKCVSGMAFQQVKPGNAPNILVLCPGYETARFVYYVCSKILHEAGICHVDIILTHGGGAEKEQMVNLLNGCHILISTPRCWLRLYKHSQLLTNLGRLCYVVLEDADTLFSKYPEVKQILQLCKKVSTAQCREIVTVCVAETWTKHIQGLASGFTENACLCFGSCLEAAVYAKLHPNIYFVAAENKDKKTIRILGGSYSLQRTVVVCVTREQVTHLAAVLEAAHMKVLYAHEDMPSYDLGEVRSRWLQARRGNFPVLLCSDDVLLEMNVTDATSLIQYSLPTSSKTQFGFRFSCLMTNFCNMFSSSEVVNLDCSVHILVESSDILQFPTLITLVKRLGGVLTPQVEAKYLEVTKMQEMQKVSKPFCHDLKALGSCWKMQKCPSRHFLDTSLGQRLNLPCEGQVKLKVVHVHSANCFSVRLLEHHSSDGTKTLFTNQCLDLAFRLHQQFSSLENRVTVGLPSEGKVYAIPSGNVYHRALCEKVEKNDVVVKFIDEGAVKTCKVHDLLPLPEELASVVPQVVEVVVCGVIPHDNDTTWSMLATQAAFDWVSDMAGNEDQGVYLAGKIVLSLGGTMWLSCLVGRQYLADIRTDIFVSSLTRELIQGGYAVPNADHVNKLHDLCKEAGILPVVAGAETDTLGENDSVSMHETQQAVPQVDEECQQEREVHEAAVNTQENSDGLPVWETLSTTCEVELSLVSPGEFYVQKKKNSDKIELLTDQIQDYVASHNDALTAEVGLLCLGKWPEDNLWYRAKIVKIFEDNRIELFSVDLGDFTLACSEDIAVMPPALIAKLPFQAIECELADVKPLQGDVWEESINEEFYNLANEEFNWTVEVVASSEAAITGGWKYCVRLQGLNEHGCIDVNQELVNLGLATLPHSPYENDFDVDFTEEEILDLFHRGKNSASPPVLSSNKIVELEEGQERLPCSEMAPPLASRVKVPHLSWYQNTHKVCFEVQVPGAEQYSALCTPTYFQFRATVSGEVYYVSLVLCGVVKPQKSLCMEIFGGFRFKLRKHTAGFRWPYLVIPMKNMIKANWSVDHIDVPEEKESESTDFLPMEYKSDDSDREREFLSQSDDSGDEATLFS